MSVRVSTAELPGHDGWSEDRVFVTSNAAVLLDGVGPLDPGDCSRSGWYPEVLGTRIVELIDTAPYGDLREIVSIAIADVSAKFHLVPGNAPSSTVAIVRWGADVVEGLVLADSPIVVFGSDGGVDVLQDGRHDAVVAEVRRDAKGEQERQVQDGEELQALIRTTRPAKLARRNQKGGYWVAEADPEAGRQAIVRRWPIETVNAVLAVTDGVSCGVVDYAVPPSWSAALELAQSEGLAALLQAVHQAETADPYGRRWPRPKIHDDKAGALISFDKGTP